MATRPRPRPWHQAELAGADDRLGAGDDPELAVDGLGVRPDGVDRNVQLAADLPQRQLGGEQPQDRQLPLGERRGGLHPPPRPRTKRSPGLLQQHRKHARVGALLDQARVPTPPARERPAGRHGPGAPMRAPGTPGRSTTMLSSPSSSSARLSCSSASASYECDPHLLSVQFLRCRVKCRGTTHVLGRLVVRRERDPGARPSP